MENSFLKKYNILNSRFILREKRFVWLDYDKGISIILVAYGHSYSMLEDHNINMASHHFLTYINIFFYGFRMPLFFIVSGMLISGSLKKRGLTAYLINRVNNIFYPLMVWGCLQITLALFSSRFTHSDIKASSYFDLLINPRQTGIFWYLNALFFIGVIYSCLKVKLNFNILGQLILGSVLFCIAGYININHLQTGMLGDVCQFYFFFALGDAISKTFLNEDFIKRYTSWKVFLPLLIIFVAIQYFYTQINLQNAKTPDGILYVEHQLPWFYFFEALTGCATSVSFSFLLQKYRVFPFFRVVGFHSLFIYCMQMIVMTFLRMVLINALHMHSVPLLFILIWGFGVLIPMVFYNFCLKINAWWLFTFKKPMEHYDFVQQAELQ